MAKHTFPPLKKKKSTKVGQAVAPYDDDEWRRRVSLPVNDKILDTIEVGDMITLTIKAKVLGKSENTDHQKSRCDLSIEIASIEI